MIILGIILIVVGALVPGLGILVTIGIIVAVIGAVLWLLGGPLNRPVGGRRYWY